MRTLLIIMALLSTLSCWGQQNDCLKFRNGTFEIQDKVGYTLIKRKGKVQTEQVDGKGPKLRLHVKWLDDCTYTLTPTKRTLKRLDAGTPRDAVLTVTMIEVKPNSYIQRSKGNHGNSTFSCEMIKID